MLRYLTLLGSLAPLNAYNRHAERAVHVPDRALIAALYPATRNLHLSDHAIAELVEATQRRVTQQKLHKDAVDETGAPVLSPRSSGGFTMSFKIEPIVDYGCNCRARKDFHTAIRARYMDDIDAVCRMYVNSLFCLEMTYNETSCTDLLDQEVKEMIKYDFELHGDGGFKLKCEYEEDLALEDFDKAECRMDLCILELNAFADMQGLKNDRSKYPGGKLNPDYTLGIFVPEETCHEKEETDDEDDDDSDSSSGGGGKVDVDGPVVPDSCCGGVPYFTPYSSLVQSCCFIEDLEPLRPGTLFNFETNECCETTGSSAPIGECPAGRRK